MSFSIVAQTLCVFHVVYMWIWNHLSGVTALCCAWQIMQLIFHSNNTTLRSRRMRVCVFMWASDEMTQVLQVYSCPPLTLVLWSCFVSLQEPQPPPPPPLWTAWPLARPLEDNLKRQRSPSASAPQYFLLIIFSMFPFAAWPERSWIQQRQQGGRRSPGGGGGLEERGGG